MSSSLEPGISTLVHISAALGSRDPERIREAIEAAVEHEPAVEVEEVLVQAYLFLGFPASLNALAVWRACSGQPAPAPSEPDGEGWERRGEHVCRRVYGDTYPDLRRNIAGLHPDMDRWMVEEGYGKVLGRGELALEVRELCIAALLAALDAPVQLYSHVRGCVRLGASEEALEEVLAIAAEYSTEAVRTRSIEVLERVLRRAGRGPAQTP